jgi:hypothetical protein
VGVTRHPRLVILDEALQRYPFRGPEAGEDPAVYLRALVEHVRKRDMALAHELLLGKRQAEWSPEEVHGFARASEHLGGASEEFSEGVHVAVAVSTDHEEVSEVNLLRCASRGLEAMMQMRREAPTRELRIMLNVLLTTGELTTYMPAHHDRLALLKHLVRTQPVFGFFLLFDAFIHNINDARGPTAKATKRDALLMRIGTRERHWMKTRPYRVLDGGKRAVFDNPPPPDLDMLEQLRAQDRGGRDVYMGVFAVEQAEGTH